MRPRDVTGDAAPRIRTAITTESLDDGSIFTDLAGHAEGAVLIFQGRVRDRNQGRAVTSITYEAYTEMAERELAAICEAAANRFDVGAISAAHRTGELALGEASVSIGVASAHRDAAYAASRWIIEEIKRRLPVWKHEHFADGTSAWVGAPEGPDARIPAPGSSVS